MAHDTTARTTRIRSASDRSPRTFRRLALSLAALIILSIPTGISRAAADDAAVTIGRDGTPQQRELIAWATGRFESAGLEIPRVLFRFHDDPTACYGRNGAHSYDGTGSTIDICTPDTGRTTRLLYLHELAHAWDAQYLSDETRTSLGRIRDMVAWRSDDPAVSWHEKGAEQAAEVISWGLADAPFKPIRIFENSCGELTEAFETLTGSAPLTPGCIEL